MWCSACGVPHVVFRMWCSTCGVPHVVPQGSALAPLLLLLYVNDFPNFVKQPPLIMFTDDATF